MDSEEKLSSGMYRLHSTVGEIKTKMIEAVQNEFITMEIENRIFNKMGYVLRPIRGHTMLTCWLEFDDEENQEMLEEAVCFLVESLKRFVEYVEEGGDIDVFDKNKILISM